MAENNTSEMSARGMVHKLITTMRKHHHVFDKLRERTGLGRSAHRMLMELSDADGAASQTWLAEKLEISTAAVAVMLKKMEADGYILRKTSAEDSRFNAIELTKAGKDIVAMSKQSFEAVDAAIFDGFSKEEMAQLDAYVDRISINIRSLEEKVEGGDFN